jgi:hypothetical protein
VLHVEFVEGGAGASGAKSDDGGSSEGDEGDEGVREARDADGGEGEEEGVRGEGDDDAELDMEGTGMCSSVYCAMGENKVCAHEYVCTSTRMYTYVQIGNVTCVGNGRGYV